jgi:iron-sulfur cluster insertion protein
MINITESARQRVTDILYDENRKDVYLRVFVQGGGCSGFQYGFMLDYEKAQDDFSFDINPFGILVDAMSMQYLQGSEIDYKEELMGSSFVINNPNSSGSCGCGSSFSV